jgi:hypothetical protein
MDIEPIGYCSISIFGCRQELGIQTAQRIAKNQTSQCICDHYLKHMRSGARHIRKKEAFFI